jgi:hypothetical protein
MKTIADILREARALIVDPEHWTQGHYAESFDGCEVPATDPMAFRFCPLGAVRRVVNVSWGEECTEYADAEIELHVAAHAVDSDFETIAELNDFFHSDVGHRYVMQAFDIAIDNAMGGR